MMYSHGSLDGTNFEVRNKREFEQEYGQNGGFEVHLNELHCC